VPSDEVKAVESDRSETSDPATSGLLYAPERPGRRRPARQRQAVAYRNAEKNTPISQETKSEEGHAEAAGQSDLDDQFHYRCDGRDDERAVRAASFLLDWATDEGNEQVDPILVQGISRALSLAADNMAMDLRRRTREQEREHSEAGND
jgi:hypothetical protein